MTTSVQPPQRLFQDTLEERHRLFVLRLAQLTACSRQPDRGGYDPAALDALIAWARQGVSDAALALQRMSLGSYGVCEGCGSDIPVGHLRNRPEASHCVPCLRERPDPAATPRTAPPRQHPHRHAEALNTGDPRPWWAA
ncbi:TraR/DksA family transcriptional regulator [Spirilliplanes yamanashiensis]|uniref:Zinc finger DksA/TraR C4-type domain-containing protein n=1 Tax=Spirilliplanes yamanashiensis TaxID=42233 RepID=A0A8J3YC17_9ACTN|nr:TraR/DksA C4-type zinc finger protein [Spirilliplanes yamanashiensis]MDP9818147.1 RNA polymerase-binding transcription factor DksA [Spirilliplanes yamanashiensis]GIJ04958.1 hypothetical protein Sya03_43100 [Spirilliplanes yamanashiensis]